MQTDGKNWFSLVYQPLFEFCLVSTFLISSKFYFFLLFSLTDFLFFEFFAELILEEELNVAFAFSLTLLFSIGFENWLVRAEIFWVSDLAFARFLFLKRSEYCHIKQVN